MSDASLPKNEIFHSEIVSPQLQTNQRRAKRKGFLAAILEALHHSRRLEAQRVLRRYQHLIDSAAPHQARDPILKGIDDDAE
jgi:hypothetical protein